MAENDRPKDPEAISGKAFRIGDILTITTDAVLTPDIDSVYEILDYMSGDSLFTHQLLRTTVQCRA